MPSDLGERLKARIRREGPLRVDDYMAACLLDRDDGYYRKRTPIGSAGDFITAPEISQIFGELIGLWCAVVWESMGRPDPVQLIELGPGRGVLMADALRAARVWPAFLAAARVTLVEIGDTLRAEQEKALADHQDRVIWCERIEDAASGPSVIIANEFFDALPVRQFVRADGGWRERCVALDADGALCFALADEPEAGLDTSTIPDGALIECCPAAERLVSALGERAKSHPLAALIMDYGHVLSGFGETFQAVRRHRSADPLEAPGEADLTAHVDFEAVARAAKRAGLVAHGPIPQATFLLGLGLGERRDRLMQTASPEQAEAVASGAARLVDAEAMGALFKAAALTSPDLPAPPSFAEALADASQAGPGL